MFFGYFGLRFRYIPCIFFRLVFHILRFRLELIKVWNVWEFAALGLLLESRPERRCLAWDWDHVYLLIELTRALARLPLEFDRYSLLIRPVPLSRVVFRRLSLSIRLIPGFGANVVPQTSRGALFRFVLELLVLLESVCFVLIIALLLWFWLLQSRVIDWEHLLSNLVMILLSRSILNSILCAFRWAVNSLSGLLDGRISLYMRGHKVVFLALLGLSPLSFWVFIAKPDNLICKVGLIQMVH